MTRDRDSRGRWQRTGKGGPVNIDGSFALEDQTCESQGEEALIARPSHYSKGCSKGKRVRSFSSDLRGFGSTFRPDPLMVLRYRYDGVSDQLASVQALMAGPHTGRLSFRQLSNYTLFDLCGHATMCTTPHANRGCQGRKESFHNR